MEAQQPPPNWAAFNAATGSLNQSANLLLQHSANIPANLAVIASELKQLEHQPTNAMLLQQVQNMDQRIQQQIQNLAEHMQNMDQRMQQQFMAMNLNTTARLYNAILMDAVDHLSPLRDQQTGEVIADFPAHSQALSELSWAQQRALGNRLGLNAPGHQAAASARANFLAQLRSAIGLKPRLGA